MLDFSKEELQVLMDNLHTFPPAEQVHLLAVVDEVSRRAKNKRARESLLTFVQRVMPDYKVGPHHKQLAQILEDMAYGRKDRVTVSIAPRMGKSLLTSIFYPAWYIGNFPENKVMVVSHTADLAVDFGRKVRNLIATEEYQEIFPGVALAKDSKSAGRWATNQGGEFNALGVGGAIAGKGANLLCLHHSSRVITPNGVTTISDLACGDKVLGHYGWEKVTNKWSSSKSNCVKIDDVTATTDHPFLTTDGWKDAGCLVAGDRILTVTLWRRLWIVAKNLLARRGRA